MDGELGSFLAVVREVIQKLQPVVGCLAGSAVSLSLRQLQSLPPTPSSAVKRGLETVSP